MDRFLGRHPKRIDVKGRVSIPASFRAVLSRDGFEGLFAVRSLLNDAVEAGGNALIGEIDAALAGYDTFSPEYQSLSVALMGGGDTLSIDAEGRIVVADWIRAATGVTTECVFVGQGTKFQIWEPAAFARFEETARAEAAALLRSRASSRASRPAGEGTA